MPMNSRIESGLNEERVQQFTMKLQASKDEFVVYDLSKTHLTLETLETYKKKLEDIGAVDKIDGILKKELLNFTEKRPVLHSLLRSSDILDALQADNTRSPLKRQKLSESDDDTLRSEKAEILAELEKIREFCKDFETRKGVTGKPLDTVVSIGIGGSDLGPRMATEALQFYRKNVSVHFISNVDCSESLRVFDQIDVEKTLFIVVSKTFTTAETIGNFKLALSLVKERIGGKAQASDIANSQFVAISANTKEASNHGISQVFKMWDFVGGRYSMWSAVGLSIALYVGFDNFVALLRGAAAADADFFLRRLDSVASYLAINELFYIENGYNNKCLVAYDSYLGLLYKYLQQAEMESNGKAGSGQMIIWGGVGTDVQHSFFQLLHQGEQRILTEFLLPIKNIHASSGKSKETDCDGITENIKAMLGVHQKQLIANCLAQSRSLMLGRESEDLNKREKGDKPSVTILYTKLSPEVLGTIIATYEHKIFLQGIYFGINSFDQFGVQLGKEIAIELEEAIDKKKQGGDKSTEFLIGIIDKFSME